MKPQAGSHESFHREEAVAGPSNRGFGITFAVVFGIVALLPFLGMWRWLHWAAVASPVFLILAFAAPSVLGPLNRAWMAFGALLHKIVQPLVMGLMFFGAVTPFGLVRRLFRRDPLHLRFDRAAPSYWVPRGKGEPKPDTMKDQF